MPDGLKVADHGYVLAGTVRGLDFLSERGGLMVRVQTNFTVQNSAWVGDILRDLWVMGEGWISRVRWGLKGV